MTKPQLKKPDVVRRTTQRFKTATRARLPVEADLFLLGERRGGCPKELEKLPEGVQKERRDYLKRMSAEDQARLKAIHDTSLLAKYEAWKGRPALKAVYSSKFDECPSHAKMARLFAAADAEGMRGAAQGDAIELEKKLTNFVQNLGKEDETRVAANAEVLHQLVGHFAHASQRTAAEIFGFLALHPLTTMEKLRQRLVNSEPLV